MLWLNWSIRLTLSSIFNASILSAFVILYLYITQSFKELNSEVNIALFHIFKFWFMIFWSLTILLALFRALKYIFNHCYNGYKLTLLTCPKDGETKTINIVGYGDLVKVWRKWFMLIIWLVAGEMVVSVAFMKFFSSYHSIFDWFNIYVLYAFVLISGYFSFMILSSRCKRVRLVKC